MIDCIAYFLIGWGLGTLSVFFALAMVKTEGANNG